MEQSRSIIKMIIVILVLQSVTTFLVHSRVFIPFTSDNIQSVSICLSIISIIIWIISPFFVFIGFYYLGKKFDLKSNLKSVIIRLLVGAFLGQFLGITILNIVKIILIEGFNFYWHVYMVDVLSVSILGTFFAAFTALAIAYLKQID
jgi:hypothetical protein